MPMPLHLTWWDLVLVVAVSLQTAAMAYVSSPRAKAVLYTVPVPFTIVTLSLGRPIGAMNVLAVIVLFVYIQGLRLLHQRAGVPIVPAIALALLGYCALGWLGAQVVPSTPVAFWAGAALTFALSLGLWLGIPARAETPHRTPLPVWVKLPVIFVVVLALLIVKQGLQGFATLFPLVGVVGAYETRHSLWTLGRQVPVFMASIVPLMVVTYLLQDHLGLPLALAAGWGAFLPLLFAFSRRHWRSNDLTAASIPDPR
ncbi:MAG: hypothetical protein ABIL09_03820 [Gemmatimonadota bacterium]